MKIKEKGKMKVKNKFMRRKSSADNKNLINQVKKFVERKEKAIREEIPQSEDYLHKITDADLDILLKELAERKLIEFVRQAWHVLEPDTPYVDGWHLHAICEHLEAVYEGKITRLLINIPPRCMKSLAVSVFFPCWIWTRKPEKRMLFSSYSSDLSERDGDKCATLINSQWYKKNWGNNYTLIKETSNKIENSKRGYRISTSVGGMTTGEGGDLICFPYNEIVYTEKGKMKIGDIVENKLPVRVWSMNLQSGRLELKEIEGWRKNPSADMVQVTFSDGSSIRCTPDHKIWTTKGYIMAQDLKSSDMLPCFTDKDISNISLVNTEHSGKFPLRQGRLSYLSNLLFSKLCLMMKDAFSSSAYNLFCFGNSHPRSFKPNIINGLPFNLISFSKFIRSFFTFENGQCLLSVQNSPRSLFEDGESPMSFGVRNVFTSCSISKVRKPVVRRFAVKMSNFLSFTWFSDKSQKNSLMNKCVNTSSFFSSIKSGIASGASWCFKNLFFKKMLISSIIDKMRKSFYPTERRDLVQSVKSRYISPVLVKFCFHSDSSYCLTIKDNHNFIVSPSQGENNILVANCVDDPHNAKEISSEIKRLAVLRWWDEAMSTRLNDQKTGAKIIVMQRLHEKDLSGHVLSKDDSYVHLCLPARYEVNAERTRTPLDFKDPRSTEGEILWPDKFTDEDMKRLEADLGEYARAGQLQQRPSPRGGGLFKVANFLKKSFCDFNEVKAAVRYWDKAGTQDGGCFTCGVLMFWMKDGSFFIYDVVAGQWNATDRERHIVSTVKKDTHHSIAKKYKYCSWSEQEPGSSGKESSQATIKRLAGYRMYADRVTGNKESRATDFAVQVEACNVCVLDADWTEMYFIRMEFYPLGEYKDWGDASSGAFNKLVNSKKAGTWGRQIKNVEKIEIAKAVCLT